MSTFSRDFFLKKTVAKSGAIAAVIFIFITIAAAIIYREFMYARNLEITGEIIDVQWKTSNHQLPKFIILDEAGKKIELSQFTIALKPSTVEVGDKIQKREGSRFCTINGKTILFSSY